MSITDATSSRSSGATASKSSSTKSTSSSSSSTSPSTTATEPVRAESQDVASVDRVAANDDPMTELVSTIVRRIVGGSRTRSQCGTPGSNRRNHSSRPRQVWRTDDHAQWRRDHAGRSGGAKSLARRHRSNVGERGRSRPRWEQRGALVGCLHFRRDESGWSGQFSGLRAPFRIYQCSDIRSPERGHKRLPLGI